MTKLTKREQLEKAVVDTKAAFDVAEAAYSAAAWHEADAWDNSADAEDAWFKVRLELADYLKEQDNVESN